MRIFLLAMGMVSILTATAFAKARTKATAQDLIAAERGLEGWLSFFDEGAVIFPKGKPPIKGLGPIRAYYLEVGFTPEGLTWEPLGAEIAASGDLGYTYGSSRYEGKDKQGGAVTVAGRYLTTWRRQGDGGWKILADIGNSDPPKPSGATP